jgi:hypothetical protein
MSNLRKLRTFRRRTKVPRAATSPEVAAQPQPIDEGAEHRAALLEELRRIDAQVMDQWINIPGIFRARPRAKLFAEALSYLGSANHDEERDALARDGHTELANYVFSQAWARSNYPKAVQLARRHDLVVNPAAPSRAAGGAGAKSARSTFCAHRTRRTAAHTAYTPLKGGTYVRVRKSVAVDHTQTMPRTGTDRRHAGGRPERFRRATARSSSRSPWALCAHAMARTTRVDGYSRLQRHGCEYCSTTGQCLSAS